MRRIQESQTKNARSLRATMTDAERNLWHSIRKNQLGVRFRRQHPIEKFTVDFACLDQKVVLEIDGGQHANESVRDESRTRILEAHGFKVLRFWNNEVLQNLEGVLQMITQELASHPHPGLPPQRGKERNLPSGSSSE